LGHGVAVTDLDSIIAVSKLPKKDFKEKSISKELEELIENRISNLVKDNKLVSLYKDDSMDYKSQIIMPIISSSGDCIGSICLVSKNESGLNESDEKLLKVASNFLGKQVQ
ncbi:MAG: stage V sporulation T C-terminal domain-containing protein, partial [Terrisporobacter sp.]